MLLRSPQCLKRKNLNKKIYLIVCVTLLRNHLPQTSMSGPLFLSRNTSMSIRFVHLTKHNSPRTNYAFFSFQYIFLY